MIKLVKKDSAKLVPSALVMSTGALHTSRVNTSTVCKSGVCPAAVVHYRGFSALQMLCMCMLH